MISKYLQDSFELRHPQSDKFSIQNFYQDIFRFSAFVL